MITTDQQRAGLLVAVISGGRPALKQRPTAKFLPDLRAIGVQDVVWVVNERDAGAYEPDGNLIVTYTQQWAHEYATAHWMRLEPPDPDGFFGAFPGREWACLEAERRGCWGVLQLDDNIIRLTMGRNSLPSSDAVVRAGGMGLFGDVLAAIALSTNSAMTGAQLSSIPRPQTIVARTGFPYSLFIEKVGEGRESWNGPYEDDITHALQYATRSDGVTAAVVTPLTYMKESKSKTGMRAKYDSSRAVQLQRIFPQTAHILIKSKRSNGAGDARVFHQMGTKYHNPLRVRDAALFGEAREYISALMREWFEIEKAHNRMKVRERAAKYSQVTG